MTRAEFFKRIGALCGIGFFFSKAVSATQRKPDLTVTNWGFDATGGKKKCTWWEAQGKGWRFFWTGNEDDDWRNPHNWDILTKKGYICSIWDYPNNNPKRTDYAVVLGPATLKNAPDCSNGDCVIVREGSSLMFLGREAADRAWLAS